MSALNNAIVHLTMRSGETVLSIGTGVLYLRNEKYYIVTAWHNVTGLHTETMEHLNEQKGMPDNIVATIAISVPNKLAFRLPVVLPLYDEYQALFYIHPNNYPRIDVVAIPIDPNQSYRLDMTHQIDQFPKIEFPLLALVAGTQSKTALCPIQNYLAPQQDVIDHWFSHVAVTEELFIPGYPYNIQDYYVQPVWKRATVASSVQAGWNSERKFLIDTASKSGMSGAPAVHYSPNGIVRILGTTYHYSHPVTILAGIYVGRIGVTKEGDPQIGTVWHQSVIDEIIDSMTSEQLTWAIEVSETKLDQAVLAELSTCSKDGIENIKNPALPSRFYARTNVLKALEGRASPKRALEAILRLVETYNAR